jgi:hypothetical protein
MTHITNKEFYFMGMIGMVCLQIVAHIILLFFIARKNADLSDIRFQKMLEHGVAE